MRSSSLTQDLADAVRSAWAGEGTHAGRIACRFSRTSINSCLRAVGDSRRASTGRRPLGWRNTRSPKEISLRHRHLEQEIGELRANQPAELGQPLRRILHAGEHGRPLGDRPSAVPALIPLEPVEHHCPPAPGRSVRVPSELGDPVAGVVFASREAEDAEHTPTVYDGTPLAVFCRGRHADLTGLARPVDPRVVGSSPTRGADRMA